MSHGRKPGRSTLAVLHSKETVWTRGRRAQCGDDRWSVNASVSHLRLKTTATLVGAGGTTTGELKLNPVDDVVRLGYRF